MKYMDLALSLLILGVKKRFKTATPHRGRQWSKRKTPGSKLKAAAESGKLAMCHPGGIVSEAYRNIARERNFQKLRSGK